MVPELFEFFLGNKNRAILKKVKRNMKYELIIQKSFRKL